jgi:hypothetical protein
MKLRLKTWTIPLISLVILTSQPSTTNAAQYKILITGAQIAAKKKTETGPKAWDVGLAKPDPYAIVELGGQRVCLTEKAQDADQPRWITATGYWPVERSTRVRITLRDSDAGKLAARAGMVGVSVRPEIPDEGKQAINDLLTTVDTDDLIAEWSGTLDQLIAACGGVNRSADVAAGPGARTRFLTNNGLERLTVRVIERPDGFTLSAPRGRGEYLGLAGAAIESEKRKLKLSWDAGLGGQKNPDPHYIIYVNGEPALAGGKNGDSFRATWGGGLPGLNLEPDDVIAISVLDADAGTLLAGVGKHAMLYSDALSDDAKRQLFKELSKASTDDPIFLWVGSWQTLKGKGDRFTLGDRSDPGVWFNDGLESVTVTTALAATVPTMPPVDILVRRITVKTTKADGKDWDVFRGKPDPFVKCFIESSEGGWELLKESEASKDSYAVAPDLRIRSAKLVPGRKLMFEVYDNDGASNDLAGTVVITIPEKPGNLRVAEGQIGELQIGVEKR